MRALTRNGPSKSLTLTTDLPEPSSDPNFDPSKYYTIRTRTVALTRSELTWPEPLSIAAPIPGFDIAGTIVACPSGDPNFSEQPQPSFKRGDEVYALTSFGRQGDAREISIALENELALKPNNISWEEAASIPLSALSAYQALFIHGQLEAPLSKDTVERNRGNSDRKRVLVTAASGGVGVWGVQLAHAAGHHVVGTSGSSNAEFVKGLGADVVLDYSKNNVKDWANEDRDTRAFDVVLDCVGGQTLHDAWKTARKGGRVISVAEPPETRRPEDVEKDVESAWFIVEPNAIQLGKITRLVESGCGRGIVDSVYDLEDWEKAFERLEGGHAKGKVILKVT
jgi:NADPH:quinone reductase-like Zn-dependent oxidoreductase